jgi:hypothetical protein
MIPGLALQPNSPIQFEIGRRSISAFTVQTFSHPIRAIIQFSGTEQIPSSTMDHRLLEGPFHYSNRQSEMEPYHDYCTDDTSPQQGWSSPRALTVLAPGQIVRLCGSEYNRELAQIVATNPENRAVLVKLYPQIDYAVLRKFGCASQKMITASHPGWMPETRAFDKDFFEGQGLHLQVGQLEVAPDFAVLAYLWDGDYYIGKFMYSWIDLDWIQPIDEEGITKMEKWRFQSGVAQFEPDIPEFVETMNVALESQMKIAPISWLSQSRTH